ncbi:MAG: YkgJ family cysteine cluster protein [Alphaproteobacteria bacterium]|nr:YkgJ family cysteine cluster protein [Alphaproteobacteria bacterium]
MVDFNQIYSDKYTKIVKDKKNHAKIFKILPEIHADVAQQVNCLSCGACCKQYSPRFKTTDIKRISKSLKLKESTFIERYLILDNEGDYVVKQTPCPFLDAQNYCMIYEVRPSDCARFPYTDEDVFIKKTKISQKNISFCLIAQGVVNKLYDKLI